MKRTRSLPFALPLSKGHLQCLREKGEEAARQSHHNRRPNRSSPGRRGRQGVCDGEGRQVAYAGCAVRTALELRGGEEALQLYSTKPIVDL